MVKKDIKKAKTNNNNTNVDIEKSISAIRKAILTSEEDNSIVEKKDTNDDDLLILKDIVSDKETIKIEKSDNMIIDDKNSLDEKILPQVESIVEPPEKERGVESALNREINPIIKKWINSHLKYFVKKIVKEEISFISKLADPPKKR